MAGYNQIVSSMRDVFMSGRTKDLTWRKAQLKALLTLLDEKRETICEVLHKDLRKSKLETVLMELEFVRNDLITILNNLDDWAKPEKVKKTLLTLMDEIYIKSEPYGVVLIMGAWNYPIQLVLGPLLGAIAAGNAVILKPSEISENTAKFLEESIPQYMDKECIRVVNGGVPETTSLLEERFDYIFYTGNTQIAKIISVAAAKHLTPTTLELGGKSPCYVHPDSDMDLVARRIIWGKLTNSGQTCIAPDYVLCNKEIEPKLLERIKVNLLEFYGEDPQKSESLGRIVNNKHFNRVKSLLSNCEVAIGGQMDEKDNYIAPTVVINVKATDPIMEYEVFGPVLPIMNVTDEDEAIEFINNREKPLALYLFVKDRCVTKKFLEHTSSGGVCVNDCLMHCSVMALPFGGVGSSGHGAYHGKFTFDTFSHKRACLIKKQSMEFVNKLRYPPYTDRKLKIGEFALKKKLKRGGLFGLWPFIILGAILGFFLRFFTD